MTLQHSEGPWMFDESESAIVGKHTTIATFLSVDLPTEADGRLMAAAPTMLRLLRVLEGIYSGCEDRSDSALRWREAMDESGDLIRKLDGDT